MDFQVVYHAELVTEEEMSDKETKLFQLFQNSHTLNSLFPDRYLISDDFKRFEYLSDMKKESPYRDMEDDFNSEYLSIINSIDFPDALTYKAPRKYWDPSVYYFLQVVHIGCSCRQGFPAQTIKCCSTGKFIPFMGDIGFFIDMEKVNKLDIKDIPDIANMFGDLTSTSKKAIKVERLGIKKLTISYQYLNNINVLSGLDKDLDHSNDFAKSRLISKFIHLAKQLILSLGNKKTKVFSIDKNGCLEVDRLAFQSMMNLFFAADSSYEIFLKCLSFCRFNDAWSLLNTKQKDSHIEWDPEKTYRYLKLSYHVKVPKASKPAGTSML